MSGVVGALSRRGSFPDTDQESGPSNPRNTGQALVWLLAHDETTQYLPWNRAAGEPGFSRSLIYNR